jgi:hypothetical protein
MQSPALAGVRKRQEEEGGEGVVALAEREAGRGDMKGAERRLEAVMSPTQFTFLLMRQGIHP